MLHTMKMTKAKEPEAFLNSATKYLHHSVKAFFPFYTVSLVLFNFAAPDHDKNRFQGKLEVFELPWYSVREVIPVSNEGRLCWMQQRTPSSL